MVKIPRADPAIALNIQSQPHIPASYGTAPGRAMQQLGRGIGQLGSGLEGAFGTDNENAALEDQLKRIQVANGLEENYLQSKANYNVDKDDPNDWQAKRAEYNEGRFNELRGKVTFRNESDRLKHQIWEERLRGSYRNRAMNDGNMFVRQRTVNRTQSAVTSEWAKFDRTFDPKDPYYIDPTDPQFEEKFGQRFTAVQQGTDAIINELKLPDQIKDQLRGLNTKAAVSLLDRLSKSYGGAGAARALSIAQRIINGETQNQAPDNAASQADVPPPGVGPQESTIQEGDTPPPGVGPQDEAQKPGTSLGRITPPEPQAAERPQDKMPPTPSKVDQKQAAIAYEVAIEKYKGRRTVGHPRTRPVRGVIMHYTEGGTQMDGLASWANKSNTGYNYYIDRNGKVIDFAGDSVMNHAGRGRGRDGDAARYLSNRNSIGIGLMTPKGGKATPAQIKAAHALTAQLAQQHGFSEKNVFGHGEVAVGHRKATEAMDAVEYIRKNGFGRSTQVAGETPSATSTQTAQSPQSSGTMLQRALMQKMPEYQARFQGAVVGMIKELKDNAAEGYSLPAVQMQGLRGMIAASGNKDLAAEYNGLVGFQKLTSTLQQNPVALNEQYLTDMRERFAKSPPTVGQRKTLETVEKFVAAQRTALKDNAIQWAARATGQDVQPLRIGNPESMQTRLEVAQATSQRFAIPMQVFTKTERDAYAKALESGKLSIGALAKDMTAVWGQDTARVALKELSDQAPQAAMLGGHVVVMGKTQVASYAEQGMMLPKVLGKTFKPMAPSATAARADMTTVFGDVFKHSTTAGDTIIALANAAYEAKAREKGWSGGADYNSSEYRKILSELIGAREVGGVSYGGVGYRGAGWDGVTQHKVIVPHDVRTDRFDDVMALMKIKDLPVRPVTLTGRHMTEAELKNASYISTGTGKYILAREGEDGVLETYKSPDGQDYVLDFATVRPILKRRRKEWFVQE